MLTTFGRGAPSHCSVWFRRAAALVRSASVRGSVLAHRPKGVPVTRALVIASATMVFALWCAFPALAEDAFAGRTCAQPLPHRSYDAGALTYGVAFPGGLEISCGVTPAIGGIAPQEWRFYGVGTTASTNQSLSCWPVGAWLFRVEPARRIRPSAATATPAGAGSTAANCPLQT